MKETPLHAEHEKLGARMVEFGGWHMPVQYGPILEEVVTVRTKAGLFDLSHMGRVSVIGKDRERFLDTICTNFVAKIPIGAIRYSLFCREDGNPIDDLLVYRSAEEVFLVVNASNTDVDLAWMRKHAGGFDVCIQDQTEELAMIALQGQASQAILQELSTDLDLASIGYYKFGYGTVCGIERMRVSRTGYTGEDGFELYIPKDDAVRVWNECLQRGAQLGMKPIGLGARDTLRLEAGMPLYGHEIDATHNPIEAGLDFGVSFKPEKGDWIGRSALEKVAANKTRQLVGVRTDGPRVPRQGYGLYSVGSDDKLGEIVSGSVSPTVGANIGTGYVPMTYGKAGAPVEIDIKGKRQAATFCALPFFSRTRK
jgi:aminomethyltransferase